MDKNNFDLKKYEIVPLRKHRYIVKMPESFNIPEYAVHDYSFADGTLKINVRQLMLVEKENDRNFIFLPSIKEIYELFNSQYDDALYEIEINPLNEIGMVLYRMSVYCQWIGIEPSYGNYKDESVMSFILKFKVNEITFIDATAD